MLFQKLIASNPPAPEFVSYDIGTASATTSVTTTAPTNISSGNLLLAVFNCNSGGTVTLTAPSGWTVVSTTVNRIFAYKTATGSEPANYTFNSSNSFSVATCAIMNFKYATIDVFGSTSAASTNPSAPGITLAQNKSLVLCVVTANTANNSVSVTGFTELYEKTTSSAQDVSSKSFDAGATGDVATTASASGSRASLIGLKPA